MESLDLRVVVLAVIVLASWPTAHAAPVETTNTCIPVRTGDPLPPLSSAVDVREHAPIVIRGDEMLRLGLAAGVCGGTGTSEDPYRIEQWYIDAGNWTLNGQRFLDAAIEISGTTAHILVRNVTIVHAPAAGILVRDAQNVRIENVRVTDASWVGFESTFGISVEDSNDVLVTGSRFVNEHSGGRDFTSVSVERSADVTVERNVFEQVDPPPTRFFGIHAGNSTGTRISDNVLTAATVSTGRWYGIHMNDEVSPSVTRNVVTGPSQLRGTCLSSLRALTPQLTDNTLARCSTAFLFAKGAGGAILRNHVHNSTRGMLLDGSNGATLAGNRMVDVARAFNVTGNDVADFQHDVAANNTASGDPILYIRNARDLAVDASGAAMVFVVGSRDVTVSGAVPRGEAVGFTVVDSVRTTLHDLDLRANDLGLRVLGSHHVRFDRVQTPGVRVEESDDVVLANLTVRGAYVGVLFSGTDASRMERSLVEGNVVGVRVRGGNTVTVASTVVRANTVGGIDLLQPDYVRVVGSDITGNTLFGVRHDGVSAGGSRSDVSGNWWGHANGPTVSPTAAGDRLLTGNNAVVTHAPWLTAPAAGAGPATP